MNFGKIKVTIYKKESFQINEEKKQESKSLYETIYSFKKWRKLTHCLQSYSMFSFDSVKK